METYLRVMNQYKSRILMILGAHAHPAEIRAPVSSRYPEFNVTILLTPSVTPMAFMMPAYSIIDFKKSAGSSKPVPYVIWRFLQLHEYILSQLALYSTLDPQVEYGLSLDNADSIRAFTHTLVNDTQKYTNYLFSKMGYPQWLITYAAQAYNMIQPFKPIMNQKIFVCGMLHFENEPYQACKTANTTSNHN